LTDGQLSARVHAAHGDAWQAEGRLRTRLGGGAAEWPGIRLMASGIDAPQWNNGDVTDPALVDVDAVRAWYAARRVPWGVRVPVTTPPHAWPHGRHLFRKRCMAAAIGGFQRAAPPSDVRLVVAVERDLDEIVAVDAAAFAAVPELSRQWIAPRLGVAGFCCVLARLGREAVGVAGGVCSSGGGGESVGVFGVGVLERARGRGIGAALASSVASWGFDSGADLAWLNPDTEPAARIYRRLGFVETDGFDVYVDL
jgi:GNAT superfamily N-acetyltransferase